MWHRKRFIVRLSGEILKTIPLKVVISDSEEKTMTSLLEWKCISQFYQSGTNATKVVVKVLFHALHSAKPHLLKKLPHFLLPV